MSSVFFLPLLVETGLQPQKVVVERVLTHWLPKLMSTGSTSIVRWVNTEEENVSIDLVRQLRQDLSYAPLPNRVQVVILLQAENASIAAQNALLKMLEEPPAGTLLVLATTSATALASTVVSRCQVIPLGDRPTTSSVADSQALAPILALLRNGSYGQLVDLADQYTDRPTAQKVIEQLLLELHPQLAKQPTLVPAVQQLHLTFNQLNQNAHVKLSLEECFFALRGRI